MVFWFSSFASVVSLAGIAATGAVLAAVLLKKPAETAPADSSEGERVAA